VLELDDGSCLAESNAILCYLAEGTPYLPADPLARSRALSWMFFEQYSHERFIAVLKFWTYWGGLDTRSAEELHVLRTRGQEALEVMETQLRKASFFSGERYGVADIALFAYTQSAEHVGYALSHLPQVRAWLQRVREQPGYVPMKRDPLGRAPDCH
jgi:glutathione S-transferase